MSVTDDDFHWSALPACDARVEHPALRQPISLIVDDPTPGYNPAYFHSGFRNGPLRVPPQLIDEFADMLESTGMRGKFSVIPYPFGLGRVDDEVQGVSAADLAYFLDMVRSRIAPMLDITPEVLTHWNALDLSTGQLLPYWEHVWSRAQTRHTLAPYLSLSLEILNEVNLQCSGMTSPWDFGDGVEQEYAEAILDAQKAVNGRALTWYFLQMDGLSRYVPPRMSVFRPENGEAVVSIVTCDTHDFGRDVWHGGQPNPDMLISHDGRGGRLAEVITAGGPAVFHTHWQTMFSQGSSSGMRALSEVARRVEEHFGARVVWTGCAALAQYAAAAAAVGITCEAEDAGQLQLRSAAPFSCPRFTISVYANRPVRAVKVDGRPLIRAATRDAMASDCYFQEDERLYLCWGLQGWQQITIVFA